MQYFQNRDHPAFLTEINIWQVAVIVPSPPIAPESLMQAISICGAIQASTFQGGGRPRVCGTRQMLDELMLWHDLEEVSEAVQLQMLNGRPEDLPPAPPKVKGLSDIIHHYFRQGMRDRLAELTAELGVTKDRTTIGRLIAHARSLGAEKSASIFKIKRHGYEISENVARKLRQAGFAESIQMNAEDDGDE